MSAAALRFEGFHGLLERHAQPHRLGEGDAQDHQGHADGGRRQAAPRAGGRHCRPSLCRAHGARARPTSTPTVTSRAGASPLLVGTGKDQVHLLVVMTAERGLCGGFNSNIARLARQDAARLRRGRQDGQDPVPSAARATTRLRRDWGRNIVDRVDLKAVKQMGFANAEAIADKVLAMFEAGEFDVAHAVLLGVQVGDRAEADGAAADPGQAADARPPPQAPKSQASLRVRAERGRDPRRPARRATSPRRSSAACSRTPPASRARACRRWTAPRATPAT